MTGIDGEGCRWRFYVGVKDDITNLGPQGAALLTEAMKRYGKGTALPRHVSHLGDRIYEIRVNAGNNHYRVLFFHPMPFIAVGLVAFYKNSNKTPPALIELAKQRRGAWESI